MIRRFVWTLTLCFCLPFSAAAESYRLFTQDPDRQLRSVILDAEGLSQAPADAPTEEKEASATRDAKLRALKWARERLTKTISERGLNITLRFLGQKRGEPDGESTAKDAVFVLERKNAAEPFPGRPSVTIKAEVVYILDMAEETPIKVETAPPPSKIEVPLTAPTPGALPILPALPKPGGQAANATPHTTTPNQGPTPAALPSPNVPPAQPKPTAEKPAPAPVANATTHDLKPSPTEAPPAPPAPGVFKPLAPLAPEFGQKPATAPETPTPPKPKAKPKPKTDADEEADVEPPSAKRRIGKNPPAPPKAGDPLPPTPTESKLSDQAPPASGDSPKKPPFRVVGPKPEASPKAPSETPATP